MKEHIKPFFKEMVANPIFWMATVPPMVFSATLAVLAIIETLETLAWIPKGRKIEIKYALVGVAVSVLFFLTFFVIEITRYKSTKGQKGV